jgi:predicted amidohydrolase
MRKIENLMKLKAIITQFPVTFSVSDNVKIIETVLTQAEAGDLVIFPEGSVSGYATDISFLERIDQNEVMAGLDHLQKQACRREINLWVGACIQNNGSWYNAAYGFCPDGNTHIYHKINLAHHERGFFSAGNQLPVFELMSPSGKYLVGVQMCRELRYPEQWGWMARCGAQIFLHLNNAVGDDTLQSVWKSHLVSRAAETQRFVLSANNASFKQLCPTIAVAPDGQVVGEIVSPELGVLRVDLDLSDTSSWYLDQSRSDVVVIRNS